MTYGKAHSLDRAVAIAADRFLSHRFEEVAIADIAAAAHCSPRTIYDVFETKEGLYKAALVRAAQALPIPDGPGTGDGCPLRALLRYVSGWLAFASDPMTRRLFLTISGHSQKLLTLMDAEAVAPSAYWQSLKDAVEAGIRANLLRRFDSDIHTSIILSNITHNSLVCYALYGDTYVVPVRDCFTRIFVPLVTARGRRVLDGYLASEVQTPDQAQAGQGAHAVVARLPTFGTADAA